MKRIALWVLTIVGWFCAWYFAAVLSFAGGEHAMVLQGEQCKKNLQGEIQYASMLHDERDQYEQQAAALVIQRDELKKQGQELGKQGAELQRQLGKAPPSPVASPAATPTPSPRRVQG